MVNIVQNYYYPLYSRVFCAFAIGLLISAFYPVKSFATDKATSAKKQEVIVDLIPSPRLRTADGRYEIKIAGFIQYDTSENMGDLINQTDGSTIRRARFGVRGKVEKDWRYNLLFEGGGGNTQLWDANIVYTGMKNTTITAGQFKEPLGLEWNTGAPWWTFMDRALLASLTPKRSIGIMATTGGKSWRVALGWFTDEATINKSPEEDGVATGRFYITPMRSKDKVIHLGISASHRKPDTGVVRFKAKHETATTTSLAVDTGPITDVSNSTILGAEALGLWGPFSLQGEYVRMSVNRDVLNTLNFSSWYMQASWFVTNDARPYAFKKGGLKRIKPKQPFTTNGGGWGAVELAARFDTLDLTDRDISGGKMDRYTFGVNWYLNTHIRLTANYIIADTDTNAVVANDSPKAINFRAQFAF